MLAKQDHASWLKGYNAGFSGKPSNCPPGIKDVLSWYKGYVEGKTKRLEMR